LVSAFQARDGDERDAEMVGDVGEGEVFGLSGGPQIAVVVDGAGPGELSVDLAGDGAFEQPQYRPHPLLAALESQQKLADRLASSLGVSMPGASGAGHQRKAARTRWSRAAKAAPVTPIGGGRGAGAG